MAEQPDDSDDMAYEVEGNELAADMIEIEDRWGNITQVPRGKEDRITKRQVADKVLATDSFKDNTSRAAARFFMVIKRAVSLLFSILFGLWVIVDMSQEAEVKIGDAVEISACQTANMPIANSDMFPCKNGRYINHDPKRPSRVRVMSDEEMEQLGVKHPCDCPQCKKHNDFNFDIEDIDAIEYKKTRSGRGFKLPTDYVLGE